MTIINFNTKLPLNPIPAKIQAILDKQYGKNPQYYPVDFSLPEYTSAGQKLLDNGCQQIPKYKGKWQMPYKLAIANWQDIMIQLNNNIYNKDQVVNKGANFIDSTKSWFTTPKHIHKINPQFISDYDYSVLTKTLSDQSFDKFTKDLKQYLDNYWSTMSLNNTLNMATQPKKQNTITPSKITDIILDTLNIKLLGNDIDSVKTDIGKAILNDHIVANSLNHDISKIVHNYGHLIFETDNKDFKVVLATMHTHLPDYKIFIRNGMKNFHFENGKLIQDNILFGVDVKEDTIPLVVSNNTINPTKLVLSYAANNDHTIAQDLADALKLHKKQVEKILTSNNYSKVNVRIYDDNGKFLHKKVAYKLESNIKRRKDFSHKTI